MDFARKQMEKYGWKEGQGLGKNETGITNALKPKLKNNNNGLGFDISEEFTNNWWDTLYKKASDNISVTETSGTIKLSQVEPDSVEISNGEYNIGKKSKKRVEESFVKTSKIVQGDTIDLGIVLPDKSEVNIPVLSDDELFKACGGRTAHKGARHGLNLSGKLARIEKQEKILLKQMRRISLNEETDNKIEKKCKKMEKLRSSDKLDKKDDEKMSKKKKKKKRKSVSFSNAIAEVIPEAEADSSFNSEDRLGYESSSTGDTPHPPSPFPQFSRSRSSSPISSFSSSSPKPKPSPSRSPSPYRPAHLFDTSPSNGNLNNGNLPDEGIELDYPPASTSSANDHRHFEERSDGFRAGGEERGLFVVRADALLSRAEKQLKMRKMRPTERFLAETFPSEVAAATESDPRESNDLATFQRLQLNLKRKKCKLDDLDDIESDNKRERCKSCFKKSKKQRRQENVVNRIAKGLERVCKINDGNDDKRNSEKKS